MILLCLKCAYLSMGWKMKWKLLAGLHIQLQGFSSEGAFGNVWEHFSCHNWRSGVLASSGWSSGMLLKHPTMHTTGLNRERPSLKHQHRQGGDACSVRSTHTHLPSFISCCSLYHPLKANQERGSFLVPVPLQVCSHPKTFALIVPWVWNASPPRLICAPPSM